MGLTFVMSFENMEPHGVFGRIVENKRKKIELHNRMEAFGQFVEQNFEVALLSDGFAYFEERFELTPGLLEAGTG